MELINNELFILSKLKDSVIYVKNDLKELLIYISNFQEYFHHAYCITIHKSHGQM